MISLNDYQQQASGLCLPSARNLPYLSWGLASEAGEVMGKLAKAVRDKGMDVNRTLDLGDGYTIGTLPNGVIDGVLEEMGDTLWFLAVLSHFLCVTLEDVAAMNIEKLTSRRDRGVVQGSGDTR